MIENFARLMKRARQVFVQEGLAIFLKKTYTKARGQLSSPGNMGNSAPIGAGPTHPTDEEYQGWIDRNEPTLQELAHQAETAAGLAYRPLISILLPVFEPPLHILEETLHSVLDQTYPYWELCLVDGASSVPGLHNLLEDLAARDRRIRLNLLASNLGISGNSNAALEMAQGEFCALLDQDDLLAPFALYEVTQRLNREPNLDLLYSDHDLIEFDSQQRKQPLFKPAWSPEIMLSANYLTHLTVIRTSRIRAVGGFDPELDGAQDWDLFLKICERTSEIGHIPKILYHWRDSQDSTASNIWAKQYAPPAQLRAIGAHLDRLGLSGGRAFFDPSGYIRVGWRYNRDKMVSIIIPTHGASQMLARCVASILKITAYPNYEILIVNNGEKRPEEFSFFREVTAEARVRVIHYERTFNYSAVNNFGARHAIGELFLFLNNDTEIFSPDWLDELAMWADREEIGIVGAKLLHPNRTIQHAGVIIGMTGFAGHIFAGQPEYCWTIFGLAEWYRDYSAVTAACMLIRRQVFEQLGGFDEAFILCGNDVEICLRAARAGLRVIYNPFARLMHLEGATRSGDVPAQDYQISYGHYLPILGSGDPYFNPNLSYWQLTPSLTTPDDQPALDFVEDFLENLRESTHHDDTA